MNREQTATLSSPISLPCGQTLPNRIMKSALSEGLGDAAGAPDIRLERLYAQWAEGGYGLIVTGNVMVDGRQLGEPGNVVVEDDKNADALRRWAKTAQDGGSPIWMQINHPGRQANPIASSGKIVAPSAVGMAIPGVPAPRELTDDEVVGIVKRFATTARIAEEAGFDGVQVHAAHGYLVSQFLSPLSNQRADRWGGDINGRMRFLLEVVRAIRAAVSPGFAVGVKLNSADFQRGGFTEDESRAVIAALADERLDLIEISGGSYESPAMMGRPAVSASTKAREAYFLQYAETVREIAGDTPIAVTGGFRTHTGMASAIGDGACDVVGIGRPSAVMPDAAARGLHDGAQFTLRQFSLLLPATLSKQPTVRSLEGLLDLQWHTDQLHRMGAGQAPDARRAIWRTAISAVQRNGIDALRGSKRSISVSTDDEKKKQKAIRKFKIERLFGRYIGNPLVGLLGKVGINTTMATDLETIGRKSGARRIVPVGASFDDEGAWIISQHGRRSGWAINVLAEPKVRIKQGKQWRSGTAEFHDDDDVIARGRSFAPHPVLAPLAGATFRALQSDPVSVRITFDDK